VCELGHTASSLETLPESELGQEESLAGECSCRGVSLSMGTLIGAVWQRGRVGERLRVEGDAPCRQQAQQGESCRSQPGPKPQPPLARLLTLQPPLTAVLLLTSPPPCYFAGTESDAGVLRSLAPCPHLILPSFCPNPRLHSRSQAISVPFRRHRVR